MEDERILTSAQRAELTAYLGLADEAELDDGALLERAADRIGLTGELAVDPEGVLELERDQLLVVLESVAEEDAGLVEHPDRLHLSVYVRPDSEEERADLEAADLIEAEADDALEGWTYAWWGAMCTQLPREAKLPEQLEALHLVMNEAETVLEGRDIAAFFRNLKGLELPAED